MVEIKHPKEFSSNEVGMWLYSIGLGSKKETFELAGVDGSMLVILDKGDFEELGLSGLQGKKLLTSLKFSKSIAEQVEVESSGVDEKFLQQLRDENAALKAQLAACRKRAPAPAHATKPAPVPTADEDEDEICC